MAKGGRVQSLIEYLIRTGQAKYDAQWASRLIRTLQKFKLGLGFIPNATQGALNTMPAGDLRAVLAGFRGMALKMGRRFGLAGRGDA